MGGSDLNDLLNDLLVLAAKYTYRVSSVFVGQVLFGLRSDFGGSTVWGP